MPTLSIITAVYNARNLIGGTIESVLAQESTDYEYIIVDGGSTDGTLEVIRKYESQVSKVVSEPDRGVFDAMNKGIGLSSGRYLGFMNAGDSYLPQVFKWVIDSFLREGRADVYYGDTIARFDVGDSEGILRKPERMITDSLLRGPVFCHQSSFISREAFEKIGLYNDEARAVGDWCFFVNLFLAHGKFEYIDAPVSNYLEGGLSSSSRSFRESFAYKKRLGSFKKSDYLRLAYYWIRERKWFREVCYPVIRKLKEVSTDGRRQHGSDPARML